MLALVAAQDVEPGEQDGTWRIARRVAKDRVISTVDPEARHGHKSVAVRKDGFQAHCHEPDTGSSPQLMPQAHEPSARLWSEPCGSSPTPPMDLERRGPNSRRRATALSSKPAAVASRRPGRLRPRRLLCRPRRPHVSPARPDISPVSRRGAREVRPRTVWPCPLRSRCTTAKARSFSVGPYDCRARRGKSRLARRRSSSATYRQHRPMAERSISWLVAKGNRRLRYRGLERNEAWLKPRVAALNLRRLARARAHYERDLGARRHSGSSGASQGGNDTCGQKTYQRGRFTPSTPALRCGLTPEDPPTRYAARFSAERGLSNTVLACSAPVRPDI